MERLSKELAEQAIAAVRAHNGNREHAAASLRLPTSTLKHRLSIARRMGYTVPESGALTVDTLSAGTSEADILKRKLDRMQKEMDAIRRDNKILRSSVLSAELVREIIAEVNASPVKTPDWFIERDKHGNRGVPTLPVSDWHWGEVVEPKQVNYVNAFNQEIAEKRWKRMVERTINLMFVHMAKPKYDYLCLPLLGDMVSGNIHEELRETNWAPISICLTQFRDQLIWAIDELLEAFGKLYIPCVTGNHGRMDRKPRFKNAAYDNYEYLLYEMLRHHYRSEKAVHFEIAESSELLYEVAGMRYLAMHGDGWKGGSGIAGALSPMMIGRARKKESAIATNRPFDCIIHGHWHYYRNLGDVIGNGSGKGYDEYAMKNSFQFQEPIQALWVTHKDYGITASWPVYLSNKGERYS